jgi:restriction system protein
MAIPDYQSLMLPLLQLASDQQEHNTPETLEILAQEFKLTEQEKDELLPSGLETIFKNRARWARSFLKKAGLIHATGRGRFRIAQRGLDVLNDKPIRIDNKFLDQFEELEDSKAPAQSVVPASEPLKVAEARTPQESLDGSYQEMRQALAQEVLENLKGELGHGVVEKDVHERVQAGGGAAAGTRKFDMRSSAGAGSEPERTAPLAA